MIVLFLFLFFNSLIIPKRGYVWERSSKILILQTPPPTPHPPQKNPKLNLALDHNYMRIALSVK